MATADCSLPQVQLRLGLFRRPVQPHPGPCPPLTRSPTVNVKFWDGRLGCRKHDSIPCLGWSDTRREWMVLSLPFTHPHETRCISSRSLCKRTQHTSGDITPLEWAGWRPAAIFLCATIITRRAAASLFRPTRCSSNNMPPPLTIARHLRESLHSDPTSARLSQRVSHEQSRYWERGKKDGPKKGEQNEAPSGQLGQPARSNRSTYEHLTFKCRLM